MFSVESILFKDSFKNTSNDVKVNTSKSMDELVYDAYKSEEDLKFFDTYNMLNEYNTNQKVRMLKRLNNITNNIRNKNITNSCESYIKSELYSCEADDDDFLDFDVDLDLNYKQRTKGGVLSRAWKTIVEFCERVLNAIVNFVKMVFNAIASMNNKKQLEDYKKYTSLKLSSDKQAEIDKQSAKINKIKVKYSDLKGAIEKFGKAYEDSVLTASVYDSSYVERIGNNLNADDAKHMTNVTYGDHNALQNVKKTMEITKRAMLNAIFGSKVDGDNTADIKQKLNEFFYDSNSTETTCGYIRNLTENFKCFADGGFINKIHSVCKTLKTQEKKFTEFTKKLKKEMNDDWKEAKKDDEYKKQNLRTKNAASNDVKNTLKLLTTYRIKFNMFTSSLAMDFERHTIKYVNTAYKAMKAYLKAGSGNSESSSKSDQTQDQNTTDTNE